MAEDKEQIPFQTAEEYVYRRLRRSILSGEIRGGTHLNQDDVANSLRVSRTPVRQAFLRLGSEGLITNRPNRGSIVTSLSPEDIFELFEIRAVLEGFAASLAVQNIDKQAMKAIETRASALEVVETNSKRWLDQHDEFHNLICELSRRPRLTEKVKRLRQLVVPYLRLYLSANNEAEICGHEHGALVEVMRSGTPRAAEKAMREHVLSSAKGVVDFVRSQGDQLVYRPPQQRKVFAGELSRSV